jgi:hypothetical protein
MSLEVGYSLTMLVIVKLILRSKKLFQAIVFPVLDIRMDE